MRFELNVFGASTFKKRLIKKNCSPPCRADKDEKCTSSGFHSKLGCCLLLSPTTLSPTTADKRLIASSGMYNQEEGISIPVIAPDPLWLSAKFSVPLTCGCHSHCHRWFPPWPSGTCASCTPEDKIAGTAGRFWVRKCLFLLYPSALSISGGAVIAPCSSKGAGCDVQLRVCLRGTARSQPFSTHFDFCIPKDFPLRLAGL